MKLLKKLFTSAERKQLSSDSDSDGTDTQHGDADLQVSDDSFTYRNITLGALVSGKNYDSYTLEEGGYIFFSKKDASGIVLGTKIHISLKTQHANLQRAWDTILPILIHHSVQHAKVRGYKTSSEKTYQPGKEIVIYQLDKIVDLRQFLQDIESALISAGIAPGSSAPSWRVKSKDIKLTELSVLGSQFLYCANDTYTEQQARESVEAQNRGPLLSGISIAASSVLADTKELEEGSTTITSTAIKWPIGLKPPSGGDSDDESTTGSAVSAPIAALGLSGTAESTDPKKPNLAANFR